MKISFALPDGLSLGGVTTWSLEMARRLAKQDQNVSLIDHRSAHEGLIINWPQGVERVECQGRAHPDDPIIMEKHIYNFAVSYQNVLPGVIIPNWSSGTYAACAAIARDRPEHIRVIGFAHTDEPAYYDWLTYYEGMIHLLVCVSEEIACKLGELLPHRRQDIIIKPYAVGVEDGLDRGYSQPPVPIKLIYAGRLGQRQKRIFDLVSLIEVLDKAGVNFQMRIVGDGKERVRLFKKIKALGEDLNKRITMEKSLPPEDMPEVWRAADIYLSVSEYEGTSIAMLEAMAQGCVPIVTEVSGTKAIIKDQLNGFRVPVGDINTMASIIEALDNNRERLVSLGGEAHATIARRYTYQDYVGWFQEMIEDVWRQPARSWPVESPLLPAKLRKINRADVYGTLQGERDAAAILFLKLLNYSGARRFYYFARELIDNIRAQRLG